LKFLYTLLFLCFSALSVTLGEDPVVEQGLVEKAGQWQEKYKADLKRAQQLNIPLYKRSQGVTYAFAGFDIDDRPLYVVITAVQHARTISATSVWQGYGLGLNLSGSGVTIGQWEAPFNGSAHPDTTEIALSGRLTIKDTPYAVSGHASNVAYIMAGSGNDSLKVGLAHMANVHSYDFNNVLSELATAASSGLLISNHSYAYSGGWSGDFWNGLEEIDSTEDYNFGLYNNIPARMDSIAYLAPYHLPVISVGNDKGETFSGTHNLYQSVNGSTTQYNIISSQAIREDDGGADGYDCLNPLATAKNALVVGSVNHLNDGWGDTADVAIYPSSSRGPTDDGRIKPDLVAGGSPTSYATPSVTGGVALLQQHYNNLFGKYMLASTVKALLIHTANEAGQNPGPDYNHGWGLPNISKAAKYLNNVDNGVLVFEDTLSVSDTVKYYVYADSAEIKLTLCWTDPAGTPITFVLAPSMLNNRASMLVNDLDVRLESRKSGAMSYPWKLDCNQPSAAATTGDNKADNVEQIDMDGVSPGWFTVSISHKGSLLNNKQVYSLIISGVHEGLVWDGVSWVPCAPNSTTADKDVLILRNTQVTLPQNFKANRLQLENNAHLTVN